MLSITRVQTLLDGICEELPAEFYKHLNGGIYLLPGEKRNPLGANLFILGEYNSGGALGRYINIYYGSIMRIYGGQNEAGIKEKLREVLLHEFTHHLESLAGDRSLEEKDRIFLQNYLQKNRTDYTTSKTLQAVIEAHTKGNGENPSMQW